MRYVKALVYFLLGIHLLLLLAHAMFMINNHIPIFNGGEGIVLAYSRLAAQGKSVYQPGHLADFPFAYPIYPPVYYYVCGWLYKIFGVSNGVGRCVAFLSTITSGVFIGLIVRHRTRNSASAWLAALIFLSMIPVFYWSAQNRVDTLSVALSIIGVWAYYRLENRGSAWLLCVPFFVLSLFTKQNSITAPAALFFTLLVENRKKALQLFLACALAGGGSFLIANLITDHGFFLHVVRFNSIAIHPMRIYIILNACASWVLLILPFGFMLYSLVTDRKLEFETIFIVISLFVAVLTLGYWGSSTNYFLPLCAALALSLGAFHAKIQDRANVHLLVLCLLLTALAQNLFLMIPQFRSMRRDVLLTKPGVEAACREIKQRFSPNDLLLFEDIQIPLVLNRRVDFYSTQDFNVRLKQKLYNRDYLLESIRNRRWKAIVLTGDYDDPARKPLPAIVWLTKQQLRAVRENYRSVPAFKRNQKLFTLYIRKNK